MRLRSAFLAFFLSAVVGGPAFAALGYTLEYQLRRAKVVFIGEVFKFECLDFAITVQSKLRGDPGARTLFFTLDPWGAKSSMANVTLCSPKETIIGEIPRTTSR